MTVDKRENYEELVEQYGELIDDSYEIIQDFSGYMIEAEQTLREDGDVDYLRNTLAASGATAPEVLEAKENLDNMVQQLELDSVDSLEGFIESVLINPRDQEYSFEHQSQCAMMEALVINKDKIQQVDENYHRGTSLEADLGNISFKIAL